MYALPGFFSVTIPDDDTVTVFVSLLLYFSGVFADAPMLKDAAPKVFVNEDGAFTV